MVKAIESLGLPDLRADAALLVSHYYYRLGAEKAKETMREDFGDEVEDKLRITLAKRGTLERPGMNTLLDRTSPYGNDLYQDYQALQEELTHSLSVAS